MWEEDYLQFYDEVTDGEGPEIYLGPEEQGKSIVKCSILKTMNLDYDNVTREQEYNKKNAACARESGRYSVYDIADWFLSKEEMAHKKLQKLCYYAQKSLG